jgi:cardiolipin synthase
VVVVVMIALGIIAAVHPRQRDIARTSRARRQTATQLSRDRPLTLISEPGAGIAPFLAQIAAARRSINLTMYELTDPTVQAALIAAARRGVTVRVLLDRAYAGGSENQAAFSDLGSHGVQVRWAPSFDAITHQKTLSVDGSFSDVMTLNFDGRYASTRDFAIVDPQGADVAAITRTFDADWAGKVITPGAGAGDLVWSPGATGAFVALIGSARHAIDLENEEMDDPPATAALCAAARRGVDVRIVMTYSSDWSAALNHLAGCGAHVRLYHGQAYYIHAKLLQVDARAALVGSQNLSAESLEDNRELSIDVHLGSLLSQLTAGFDHDFSGAATATPAPTPPPAATARCSVRGAYNDHYRDYDVYVDSNQADASVTVTDASGTSASYHTDSSGEADVYLKAPVSAEGESVSAAVGAATCRGTL